MTTALEPVRIARSPLRMSEEEFVRHADEDWNAEWAAGVVEEKLPIDRMHDQLQFWLRTLLTLFVAKRDAGGYVTGPQFTMRLPQRPSRRDPDVMYVSAANIGRVGRTVCDGPADLVIEVVSPESIARDYRTKYGEYEAGGVREYWIVSPLSNSVEAHRLNAAGAYEPIEISDDKLHSAVLPGWWLRPGELFAEALPDAVKRVEEMTA